MRYIQLISRACRIVIDHPVLWVFGLFMAAGFNINWLYLNTFTHSNTVDRMAHRATIILQDFSAARILASALLIILLLAVTSVIKIIFWRLSHRSLHSRMRGTCEVCHRPADQPIITLRIGAALPAVMIISIAAVVVNTLVALSLYQLFIRHGVTSLSTLVLICCVIIAAVVSLCSVLVTLFMLVQRQRLNNSIRLTADLLQHRWLEIVEFVLLLMLLYGFSVVIGSAIISLSQSGFTNIADALQRVIELPRVVPATLASIATAIFWVWFAVTNACYNMALLLLFGELVHPVATPEAELAAAKASAGV
jgi:hypothetical protein